LKWWRASHSQSTEERETVMKRLWLVSASLLCAATSVPAQDPENFLRLGELKSRGATQVSKAELDALLPGAKVRNVTPQGSTRYWENESSGKFVVSTDLVGYSRGGRLGRTTAGNGTWHISGEGAYCVQIEWPQRTEQWCRHLFKFGDKYYGVRSLADEAAEAHEFVFSR
jgi:hypothetical protein